MLLWTVLPLELVLDGADKVAAYEEIEYGGINVLIERIDASQCRIVRLLSTQPMDYLRPDVQPGVVLRYRPVASDI